MPGDTTQLLRDATAGDTEALEKLATAVYADLRTTAQRHMRRERSDHTLQPSALVNEAFLRLVRQQQVQWQGRAHFYAVASQMMRRILVDHARKRHAEKRGAGVDRIEFDDNMALFLGRREISVLPVDDALSELSEMNERHAKIVEMRFFGGMTNEEVAHTLGVSLSTVKSDWRVARAWLLNRLSDD